MMKKSTLLLSLFLWIGILPTVSKAQDFKKKYDEETVLFNNNQYEQALPLLLAMDTMQPDNNNVQFQTECVCYLKCAIHSGKKRPTHNLIKVCRDISAEKYNPSSYKEKHAPSDATLYLAKAYHLTYQFDSAIVCTTRSS